MDDPFLEGDEEIALAYCIIEQGLQENELRDELLVQLCNQTWCNDNQQSRERGWTLLSLALGAFPPSKKLENYLLKLVKLCFNPSLSMNSLVSIFSTLFISHISFLLCAHSHSHTFFHAPSGLKEICQWKILKSSNSFLPRHFPLTVLEWMAAKKRASTALPVMDYRGEDL